MALRVTRRGKRWTAVGAISHTGSGVNTVILDSAALAGGYGVIEQLNILNSGATDQIFSFFNGNQRYEYGVVGRINVGVRNVGASVGNSNIYANPTIDPGVKIIGDGDQLSIETDGDAGQADVYLSGRIELPTTAVGAATAGTSTIGLGVSGNYWIASGHISSGAVMGLMQSPPGLIPVVDEILPIPGSGGNGSAQTEFTISQLGSSGVEIFKSTISGSWTLLRPAGSPGHLDTVASAIQITWDQPVSGDEFATLIGHWETTAGSI